MRAILLLFIFLNINLMQEKFPSDKLILKNVNYEIPTNFKDDLDPEFEVILEFEKIKIDGNETEIKLEFYGFCTQKMIDAIYSSGYNFNNDMEIESSSVYIQSVHNPVDLKFLKIDKEFDKIEFDLYFDFEYERTDYKNQKVKLEYKLDK